jgi:ATP-dependent RNA helicase RhlE
MKLLVSWGFSAGSIHGNKSQSQRERTLAAFRDGSLKVLVATDVAARGLDIPLVRHVYNYDLPNVPENYIHRIGRTARAGAAGKAIAFCAPAEMGELAAVEKALGAQLPVIGGTRPVGAPPPPKPAGGRPSPKPGPRPGPKPDPKPAAKPAPRPGGAPAAARPAGKPPGAGRGGPRRPGPRAPA